MTYPRSRCGTDGPSQSVNRASEGFRLFKTPSTPQSSPGMLSTDVSRHWHDSFFLPGLITQGMRAVLPSGSRTFPGRLGSPPRAARLYLTATARVIRARQARARLYLEFHLVGRPSLALLLFTSGWLSLRNLSLSAVVSQALRTNTAAGRAFYILSSQPVAAGEALP